MGSLVEISGNTITVKVTVADGSDLFLGISKNQVVHVYGPGDRRAACLRINVDSLRPAQRGCIGEICVYCVAELHRWGRST